MSDKDWTTSIPWLIAVLGWGVTHLFSEGRERRKEVRGQIDKVYETLSKIVRDANEFHRATARSDAAARDLVGKLRLLERQMNRIGCFDVDDFGPAIIQLRRSVTLRNFDRSEFVTQDADSDVLEGISAAAENVEDEMERQYRYSYPVKFPYIRLFTGKKTGLRIRPK
ncbi:hypothetical protein [Burkholderia gladioli]|uniref:hypothetical protein n=1 Tax=Burkholderia gladioli TaxID=28095 RepID=UPI00163EBC04|nr:hypothetical protein [Burkholderia gladioli]